MLHFPEEVGRGVSQVLIFREERVGVGHAEDLEVVQPPVFHSEQSDDTGLDETTAEGRLIDHDKDVQGIAV